MLTYLLAPFANHPDVSPVAGLFLACLAVIILGVSKSGFGGGVGILAVPLFALALGPKDGTALLLPFLLAADIFSVFHHWGTWDVQILKVMAPGTLAGIAIGSVSLYLLVHLPGPEAGATQASTQTAVKVKSVRDQSDDALNLLTGVICIGYIGLDQIRKRYAPNWHFKPNYQTGTAAGMAVGTVSTISHAAGPIAAIFLLGQNLPHKTFMGTTVIYFFAINSIKLLPFSVIGMYNLQQLQQAPWFLLLLVPVGTFLGAHLNRKISEPAFRMVIMWLVFLSGIDLITSTFGYNILSLFRRA